MGVHLPHPFAILQGIDNPKVKAMIALSPGEFFKPEKEIARLAPHISKPLFVAASSSETAYLKKMFSDTNEEFLNLFIPTGTVSHERGAGLLARQNPKEISTGLPS